MSYDPRDKLGDQPVTAIDRFWFNHYSTVGAVYAFGATFLVALAISVIQLLMWVSGDVGLFDESELAVALRPLMAVAMLPAIGVVVGAIANDGDPYDRRLTAWIIVGQIATLLALKPAIIAALANLAALLN